MKPPGRGPAASRRGGRLLGAASAPGVQRSKAGGTCRGHPNAGCSGHCPWVVGAHVWAGDSPVGELFVSCLHVVPGKDSLNAFHPHEEVGTMIPIVQTGEPRP